MLQLISQFNEWRINSHKNGENPPKRKMRYKTFLSMSKKDFRMYIKDVIQNWQERKKEQVTSKREELRQLTKICIIILPSSKKNRLSPGFGCTEMNSLRPPFSSLVLLLLVTSKAYEVLVQHVKSSQRVVEAMLQIWDETLGQPNNAPSPCIETSNSC